MRNGSGLLFSQVFSSQTPAKICFFQKIILTIKFRITVTKNLMLRGYAVTLLRVCYCINKYTHNPLTFLAWHLDS